MGPCHKVWTFWSEVWTFKSEYVTQYLQHLYHFLCASYRLVSDAHLGHRRVYTILLTSKKYKINFTLGKILSVSHTQHSNLIIQNLLKYHSVLFQWCSPMQGLYLYNRRTVTVYLLMQNCKMGYISLLSSSLERVHILVRDRKGKKTRNHKLFKDNFFHDTNPSR